MKEGISVVIDAGGKLGDALHKQICYRKVSTPGVILGYLLSYAKLLNILGFHFNPPPNIIYILLIAPLVCYLVS